MKRRAFIAGVTATAAAAPLTRASSPAPESFDREVDVVVVGSGTGLCAALRAASAGLDVLVLEKLDTPGGTTLVSGVSYGFPTTPSSVGKASVTAAKTHSSI